MKNIALFFFLNISLSFSQKYQNIQIDHDKNLEYANRVLLLDSTIFIPGFHFDIDSPDLIQNVHLYTNYDFEIKKRVVFPFKDNWNDVFIDWEKMSNNHLLGGMNRRKWLNVNITGGMHLWEIDPKSGDTVKTAVFDEPNLYEGGHLMPTSKNGYLIHGVQFPDDTVEIFSSALLVKFDSTLQKEWKFTHSADLKKNWWPTHVLQDPNGNYYLYVTVCDPASPRYLCDPYIFKISPAGQMLWNKKLPGIPDWVQRYELGYFGWAPDGNLMLAGKKDIAIYTWMPENTGYPHYSFMKITPNGELVFNIVHDSIYNIQTLNSTKTSDGNFVICGNEEPWHDFLGDRQNHGLLLKANHDGQILWKRYYNSAPIKYNVHELFYDVAEMPDGGLVAVGTTVGPDSSMTYQNIWVLRTDSLGCIEPGCDTLTPATPAPSASPETGIQISPNPTAGEVKISLSGEGVSETLRQIRVFDLGGRVVVDQQFTKGSHLREWVLRLDGEAAGVYLVFVRTERGWFRGKVLKF